MSRSCCAIGLAVAVLCVSCGPSIIVSRAGSHPPRPDSCDIAFSSEDANAAYLQYEHVGTLAVQNVDVSAPAGPDERQQVRTHACRIGGRMVAPSVSTGSIRTYVVFGAKRAKPLLAAPAAAAPPTAAAKPPPRVAKAVVAVFDIEDTARQLSQEELRQLGDYLATQLANTRHFSVVPRGQLRAQIVAQKTESYRTCFDETCQIEIGKAMAAQKSLATKLLKVGGRCAIIANLYDLRREATEAAASVHTDCASQSLLAGVEQLVQKLVAGR